MGLFDDFKKQLKESADNVKKSTMQQSQEISKNATGAIQKGIDGMSDKMKQMEEFSASPEKQAEFQENVKKKSSEVASQISQGATKVTDRLADKWNERKQERAEVKEIKRQSALKMKQARDDYDAEQKRLIAELRVTGKAGLSKYSDTDRVIILKANLFVSYAVKYDTIQAVEVRQHTEQVTQTSGTNKRKGVVGRGIVGGVVAGPVGIAVGGLTAKKKMNSQSITTENTSYWIEVSRDDPYFPTMNIGYNDKLLAKLRSILSENEARRRPVDVDQSLESRSVVDEILKLKELLDMGILTEEEFDAQKRKLLN